MTNTHANLEAWIGESATYFPDTATSSLPSATQVDAWYSGPVAKMLELYDISNTLIEDALAEDFLIRWIWRKRMSGSSSRSVADMAESWNPEPKFPSDRTWKLIRQVRGDFHYSG